MNLRPITIAVAILLLSLTGDTNARPACGNRVLCGATCTYTEIGGLCMGGGSEDGSYCWREAVESDYETVVFSCQNGSYDYCCDPEYPF